MLLPEEFIRAKRDGDAVGERDLREFVDGIASGDVSDAQVGAFTMAVHFQGMSMDEQVALTLAMRDTGHTLTWPNLNGPVLDKHSTGGVGDVVSLVLAPVVAACGAYIPMISGRGLGHTGGTLDKLESIPGFNVNPSHMLFDRTVRETGLAMTGQSAELAPADGRIYSIRDVTATVDSIPLIVASILSKKLAEGLDALVLDIKTGNGSFMVERNRSRDLAANLVQVSELAGLPCRALITDMNQPLAHSAGNALEVMEAIKILKGEIRNPALKEIALGLGTEMLLLGGLADKPAEAEKMLTSAFESGEAVERFGKMVARQGGPLDLVEHPEHYLQLPPINRPMLAPRAGCIEYIDTRAIGFCIVELGGGRAHIDDTIDHSVGLSKLCCVGDSILEGDELLTIHARNEASWHKAASMLESAIKIGRKTDALPAVYEKYG